MKHKYLRTPILLIGTLSMYSAIPTAYAADINCTAVTQISKIQCEALAAFYTSTGGDNWTKKDNWGNISQICPINTTTTPPTTTPGWYGVACQNGNVTSLRLPNNNLTGTLPDLSDLTGLQKLILNKNGLLTGALPNLASLTELQELDVGNDGLSGPLPATLSNLTKLETLFVNDNKFEGSLPDLKALLDLNDVNCNNNQLTGVIPALNTNTTLQTFTCSHNKLSGAIPALDKLAFLGTFDVSNNIDTTSGKSLLCKDAAQAYGSNEAKLAGLEDCVTTITGTVFNDMNGNGKKDPLDNGRVGTITLTSTTEPTTIITTETVSQGKYQKDVPPGTYTVTLTPPNDGSKTTTPTTEEASTLTLEAGKTAELNFGLQPSSEIKIDFVTLTSSNPLFLGVGEVIVTADGFEPQSCLKNDCTLYYPADTQLTLTAKTDGYLFGGWGGDCEQPTTDSTESNAGTSKTVTITTADANTPKNCKVKFQRFACNLAGISISESQCYALQLLYEKNNGPLWNDHANWLETLNPCNWEGVTCDPSDGKPLNTENKAVVTRLDLPSNNLANGLGETDLKPLMSTLTHLNFSNNPNLKGALPEWIGTPGPIQKTGIGALITDGTGLCKRLALDYGSLYYSLTRPDCPPPAPDAVFTMSPQPDPPATATVTPSETTEATTPDTSGTPSTSSTTTSSGTTDSSTSAVTTDGYTGYTVLFDATRSKPSTLNGLILKYEWSVSDTNNQKYYLETNQATNNQSPTPGQPIKPIAYKVTTDSTKPHLIVTDTPKLTVTFPNPLEGPTPPDGQTSINYTLSLVVTEDTLDEKGKPKLPEVPSPTKSSPYEQLVPLPLSTLIISKTGDGSGTIVATQVVKTEPPMIPATCCFDYPSAFYNATVDSAVELIADVPEGSYFNGWLGDGCNLPDTTNGTPVPDNTTTTIDPVTGSQTVRLIIDNMSLGAAKTCTADLRVIIPGDPLHTPPDPQRTLPSYMHLLTVASQGAGRGLIESPDGTLSCGDDNKTDCKENYKAGYHLRLRATPGLNSNFAIWSSPPGKETAGCTGQKKAVITIVAPAVSTDIECDANFESDSNTGGVIGTDKCYGGDCEMDTPEPIDKLFPQHFVNEARMREALSLAEPVKQLLEKQLDLTDLPNTWPDQLENDTGFYKKKPVGVWTESVRIRHDAVVDGFISPVTVQGYYIEVRVKLLTEDGSEKVLPVLVYYGEKPSTRKGLRYWSAGGYACYARRWW